LPVLAALVPVLGLRVIFDGAAVVPTAMITQLLSFRLIAMRTMIATLVSASISLTLVLLGFGLWALIISTLANSFVAAAAMFWGAGWVPRARFSPAVVADLAGYGAFASGTRLLNFLGTQVDQAVVGLVLGPFQLGLYNFARRMFAMLNEVTSGALSAVAHPLFAGIQHDRERVKRGFLLASFLSSTIAFPCFIGLACVAHLAIPCLFGPQWTGALWPVRILCSIGIVSCIGMLQAGLITSIGRANWWFYYQLLTGLLQIPIIIFVSPYGTTALLLATAAKAYLLWFIPVTMTLRLLSMRAGTYLSQFLSPLASAVAMAAAILVIDHSLQHVPIAVALAVEVVAGAAAYGLVLVATAGQRVHDLALLVHGVLLSSRRAIASNPRAVG
jgi:O-antigen/teichoic acid export membrane protein